MTPAILKDQQSIRRSDLAKLIHRYRWLVLAIFGICVLTGWITLQVFFNDLYETKASILVKVGRENTEVPATVVNGSMLNTGVRMQDINSEVQMLSSRALVEVAVDKIGPESFRSVLKTPESIWGYPRYVFKRVAREAKAYYKAFLIAANLKKRLTPREEAILGVADALKIEPVKESDVLVLKLRLPSAELAVRTANVLLSEYLVRRSAIRRNAEARGFFDEQIKGFRHELDSLTSQKEKVRQSWEISAPAEERSITLKQLADLTAQATEIDSQAAKLEEERGEIRSRLSSLPSQVAKETQDERNPAIQTLKERITTLRMERAKLVGRYQPDAPLVQKADSEIAALEESLSHESPTVLASSTQEANPLYRQLQDQIVEHDVQIAGLKKRRSQLAGPIEELQSRLRKLDAGSDAFDRAEREYKLAEESYSAYAKKREEARIAEEMDTRKVANVSVISEPELPIEPVYPRKLFIMGILLPVALVIGIAVAALVESLEDRVRDEGDLEALPGVFVLGSLPGDSFKKPSPRTGNQGVRIA